MASLMLNKVERYRSAQSSEMDSTFKTGAAMREELRKDNEALRDRITAAEERVDALELELHGVRAENEKLRLKLERMETEMRPTDSGIRLSRNDEGGLE
jgi:chromosome segregation ATPase